VCLLWTGLTLCHSALGETDSEVHTVELSDNATLLSIFNSGLHPRRPASGSIHECEIRPARKVQFKAGEFTLPVMEVECRIFVLENGALSSIEGLTNVPLSLDDAFSEASKFHKALGRSTDALKEWIDNYPASSVNGALFGLQRRSEIYPNVRVAYRFQQRLRDDKPLAMTFKIDWKRPLKEKKFRTTPVTPPPGYEHLSMEPNIGNPKSKSDINSNQRLNHNEEILTPVVGEEKESLSRWWWLFFLIATGVSVIVLWLKPRRPSATADTEQR